MRIHSRLGLLGSALVLMTAVLYLSIMIGEGDNSFGEIAPWAALLLAVAAAATAGSLLRPGRLQMVLLWSAATVSFLLGLLALLTIGLALVVAGVVLTTAARRAARDR